MAIDDRTHAEFEVVPDGAGYGVRREGEPEPISHHATREEAQAAAAAQSDQGQEVDARKDIFSGEGADATSPKHAFTAAGLFALAVVLLIVVVSLIIALG